MGIRFLYMEEEESERILRAADTGGRHDPQERRRGRDHL